MATHRRSPDSPPTHLFSAHDDAYLKGLEILQQLEITQTTLFPLLPRAIEHVKLGTLSEQDLRSENSR